MARFTRFLILALAAATTGSACLSAGKNQSIIVHVSRYVLEAQGFYSGDNYHRHKRLRAGDHDVVLACVEFI
jgi:hypothetical protein